MKPKLAVCYINYCIKCILVIFSTTNGWCVLKKTLCECGFPVFWDQQNIPGNFNYFKSFLNLRLKDQFFQSWSADMHNNSKCVIYGMYKVNLTFENYLTELPDYLRFSYLRLRCRNNSFPVERGARGNISRILRICTFCNDGSIWDEFHYLLQYSFLKTGYCIWNVVHLLIHQRLPLNKLWIQLVLYYHSANLLM